MPLSTKLVVSGSSIPVFVTAPPKDSKRLFVVEKGGRIRIFDLIAGSLLPTPFLALTDLSSGDEQGLLGLAFHPKFETNGLFYVNFTDGSGATNVREYRVSAGNPNVANPTSARTLLIIPQPFANHNGGWIAFGPDELLYIAMGDGGSANDPGNRAQNLGELLGKMLRIDVNGDDFPTEPGRNYKIPPTNPFVGKPGARPEIWAYGLRNPWRCSFDRKTGDLYIADVGQGSREEINFQPAASKGGENYGWRFEEGTLATGLDPIPAGIALTNPIFEYTHAAHGERAIIGGLFAECCFQRAQCGFPNEIVCLPTIGRLDHNIRESRRRGDIVTLCCQCHHATSSGWSGNDRGDFQGIKHSRDLVK